nr:hemicentin-1-like [Cherax quadricarinatus]
MSWQDAEEEKENRKRRETPKINSHKHSIPPESVSVVVWRGDSLQGTVSSVLGPFVDATRDTHQGTHTTILEEYQGSQQVTSSSALGPFLEGEVAKLTCVAHGGSPRPSVVWYRDSQLLDSEMESEASTSEVEASNVVASLGQETQMTTSTPWTTTPGPLFGGEPYNTLTLGPLTRSHLQTVLTCAALNSNLTHPTTVGLTLDMNLVPLSVEIRPPETLALRAGREYVVECLALGARPVPTITWWSGDQRVLSATLTVSEDKNVTTSSLVLTPRPQDNGSFLRCIVETYAAPATLEDTWNLTVQYVPKASCRFGASLDASNIKEGDDVYFECSIDANPRVTRVSWRHNDRVLVHNVSAGVIISNQSLVLQRVVRAQAGRYACHAHNIVGDGVSNALRLDVKYAPVCSPGQVTTYAVGRYEDAEVTCSVDANPVQESFQWTFNNTADTIDVPQGRFTSLSSHSVITYTPMTALDYGTLLCWAANEIGAQKEPCVFHIEPAGKPEAPGECRVGDGTQTSVRVRCEAGSSGGLPQHFHLQASLYQGHHLLNLTAVASPDFYVEGLRMESKYQLIITAVNDKGTSSATHLTVSSIGTNGSVYQLHDGPLEAEVRDGGKNGVGSEGVAAVGDGGGAFLEALAVPSFIMGVLGVGSGLVLLVILLLLFITFRRNRAPQPRPLADTLHHISTTENLGGSSNSPRRSHSSPVLTPEHHTTCLERDVTEESESDADPDIIPLQETCRCCEVEMVPTSTVLPSVPAVTVLPSVPAATVLPSDRYTYAHVPALLPPSGRHGGCHHHHHHHLPQV